MAESVPQDALLFDYIYSVGTDKGDFIAFKIKNTNTVKKIDSFKPLMNNKESESIDIHLKIIPASFVTSVITTAFSNMSHATSDFWVQIAVAEDYDDLLPRGQGTSEDNPEDNRIGNVQEAIEMGTGEVEEKGGNTMRLALYNGLKNITRKRFGNPAVGNQNLIHSAIYPMAFVESLYEDYPESKKENYMTIDYRRNNPFRLDQMYKDIYSKSQKIDISKTYKLSFVNTKQKDITSIFVANNKEYRSVKIERVVTERGFEKIAKGEFYPHN